MRKLTTGDAAFQSLNYILLSLLGIMTLYPFLNLLALSFNDSLDSLKGGVHILPRAFTLENYATMFQNTQLYGAALRSLARTLIGTGLGIFCTALFAYALSRKEFVFRRGFNLILVVTLYVNGGIIPIYLTIKNLHLTNSFFVYLLPLLINGFYIMIMRSSFEQLPAGLTESAKIDGASDFQTLFRIIIPISLPVIATITLFIAVMHWNSWFDNYLYNSRDQKLALLQYELMKILLNSVGQQSSQTHVDENTVKIISPESIRATMTIIVTVPILLIYPFLQRYFIKGITIGAIKE
ncbi:carbohydrate ABC transporter permease [Paenibacillus silvisoli]|uniref:carbohydrate ABC transporter permease n=1 Tax=Paenibacillus silvisoli TaxID=3110539 RepID=UPI002804C00A|nr:carbohydrate ABC transporter permease [Paenibacillus silvisoli]